MDQLVPSPPSKKSPSPNTVPIRLKKSTIRLLKTHLVTCNRKSCGRRIKSDDIILKALSLITDSHVEELKLASYSSQDQLQMEFKKYCAAHGAISKDEFLKMILASALPQTVRD